MTYRILVVLALIIIAPVMAAPPQLYQQPAYESPVHGAPDDLLLLAGFGLAADDIVVYRAIRDTTIPLAPPDRIPAQSSAELGIAPVVSSADAPYSLTIKLPQIMRTDQSYALWVHTARGEWSGVLKINDARPLWFSPAYIYASAMPASLQRELKIVGRNLAPGPGHSTLVRLVGPQHVTAATVPEPQPNVTLNDYVAKVKLPERLALGHYRVMVSRDGSSWVAVPGQVLDVLPDPPAQAKFAVDDPRFGGCRPNDGGDDTACIVRAIAAAARAGGGSVYFGPGTWDLIDGSQQGLSGDEGMVVPAGVQLRGAGSAQTRLNRHPEWSARARAAAFTLTGHTLLTGFVLRDLKVYRPSDATAPFLQLGEDWQRAPSDRVAPGEATVTDVTITGNIFDKTYIAIGTGGLPITRLLITRNIFGAYHAALELSGDQYNMVQKFRIDDSIIDYNVFKPGSELNVFRKSGTIVSELGAGFRVDFSSNTADGTSTEYLNAPDDAKGWRAAFFWNPNNNEEEVLVSQNTATCTGDKIGDGEAIAFDSNTNTFAFASAQPVSKATATSVTVSASLAARQHNRDVPIASYYVGHWVQVVSGPGLGQVRKITAYSTDPTTHLTTITVAPAWDVQPVAAESRISIGLEYWQLYVVANQVDNRQPLCQKSNRSRRAGGSIGAGGTADSVFAGNHQYDSDGISAQQVYASAQRPCSDADCAMKGFFTYFLEVRDNIVDGEYDWANGCSWSGISVGAGAAPWEAGPPPAVDFGVSISHNRIRRADAQYGGAIAQVNIWFNGPEPQRWPLSDTLLVHHNSISDMDGARAFPLCNASRPRVGIAFPDPAIAWRTVLYANSCKSVSMPLGAGGIDTVKVCPSSVTDSCECPSMSQ